MGAQYIEPMPAAAGPWLKTLRGRPVRWPAWPRPCVICRDWTASTMCRRCRDRFAAGRMRCPCCAMPATVAGPCGACLHQPPAYAHAVAAVDYGFPWDRLISAFKFQDQPEWAGVLADLIAVAIARHPESPDTPGADCVVPVPLSGPRLAERGYNQAWELARRLAARHGLPAHADALLRLRDTPHQVGAGRAQRLHNLRAALWVSPDGARRIAGRHVALVDDVLTTGATAEAAALALHAAGAASVQVWVVARTS
jgi:ComF family protein